MEQTYMQLAINAALAAGREILAVYDDPTSDFEIEKKADNSPLTIADRKAHTVIARILGETPYPVLSEEGKLLPYEERKAWKAMWIVDPLDGTKEFIKRNGEFTVNIALVEDGVPVAGVIYVPVKQTLYWGEVGHGAYKLTAVKPFENQSLEEFEKQAIVLPNPGANHNGCVVVASRSHLTEETEAYIRRLKELHPDVRLVSTGSSIKICLVAEGVADVYPRFAPTMEWDTAAGDAIARAAGVEVVEAETGKPLRYNKPDLHNPWFVVTKKHQS